MDAATPPPKMNHPGVRVFNTWPGLPPLLLPSTAIQTIPQVTATTPTVNRPMPVHQRHGRVEGTVSLPAEVGAETNGTTGAGTTAAGIGGGSDGNGSSVAVTTSCVPP